MAINGQQNIRIGLPNESVGSDSIRDAFTKVNTNFTNLFNNANPNIVAGNGVIVETSAGNVKVSSNLVAGNGIALANSNGAIVITNTGGGGNGGGGNVSSVQVIGADSNARITSAGGPITSAGTITLDLANSNVTAGTYNNPTLTVDRFGRITAAANNNVAGTVTSVGLSPGTGIGIAGGPITNAGIITVTNTGVTRLTAGPGVTLTGNTGVIQISLAGGGGGGVSYVDIVSNTLNATGGPITSAGNINVELKPNTTITGTLTANGLVVNGTSNITGNVSIAGNLSVDGNITYINVENLNVQDPIIQLQRGPNGNAPTSNTGKDVGTALNYYDTQARIAFMGWDVSNNEFGLASQATIASDVVTFSTYGNLRVGNIIGNGQALSNLSAANIVGQVANASIASTVYTAAQPNITSVGNLTSLTVLGNISAANAVLGNTANANYFVGNGFYLTGLNLSNVVANNANYAAFAGNVTLSSQPNITSVGTLTGLTLAANAEITMSGTDSQLSGANLLSASFLTGTLTTNAQPNITSVGTLTSLSVTGNGTFGNVYANTGTIGALTLKGEGGNISNVTAGNITGQVANALVAGTVYTAAQPNITSVGTLTGLTLAANADITMSGSGSQLTGANLVSANFLSGNGSSLSSITGSNVTGEVGFAAVANSIAGANVTGQVGNALVAGTVYTAAQPNITSVGTLSSLNVTGNASAGNLIGTLANGNSNINIPAANGNITLTAAGNANILVITGTGSNVTGTLGVTDDTTSNNFIANFLVKTTAVTFSSLPTAATAGAGARAFITDGNLAASTNFGAQVSGSGSNNVPVYSDGTNWRIG